MDAVADKEMFLSMGGTIDEEHIIKTDCNKQYAVDVHYLEMGAWAFGRIMQSRVRHHVDIGGDVNFINYLTKIVTVEHRDIRAGMGPRKNFSFIKDDITHLDMPDNSVDSLSCLHVAEHIGLGRYGDEVDPEGFNKACRELCRVLSVCGKLYFAVPVGEPRTVFNAHRVLDPKQVVEAMSGLRLIGGALVYSDGVFCDNLLPSTLMNVDDDYACGMFEFTK